MPENANMRGSKPRRAAAAGTASRAHPQVRIWH
jgi:hypothetical protein